MHTHTTHPTHSADGTSFSCRDSNLAVEAMPTYFPNVRAYCMPVSARAHTRVCVHACSFVCACACERVCVCVCVCVCSELE